MTDLEKQIRNYFYDCKQAGVSPDALSTLMPLIIKLIEQRDLAYEEIFEASHELETIKSKLNNKLLTLLKGETK